MKGGSSCSLDVQVPAPTGGSGYFVMTKSVYDGNLQLAATNAGHTPVDGIDAANLLCLDELSNNDWKGKTDAQNRGLLNTGNVRAFLCAPSGCNQGLADTRYFFARAGAPSMGGAYLDTDSTGQGPVNSYSWNAVNYFGKTTSYYANHNAASATLWGISMTSGVRHCLDFSDSQSTGADAGRVYVGNSSFTDARRWSGNGTGSTTYIGCNTFQHLLCFVDP